MIVCKLCKVKKWYTEANLVHQVQHAALGKVICAHLDIQLHHTVAFLWVLGLGAAASHDGVKAAAGVTHCKRELRSLPVLQIASWKPTCTADVLQVRQAKC